MAKMTKAQKKRMVKDIMKKTQKLYMSDDNSAYTAWVVSIADMSAIEKLCNKWMKRIG